MPDDTKSALEEKGGRLDPEAIDGAAGRHLLDARDIFRGYLEPIVVPHGGSPVTSTTPPSRIAQFEFVRQWDVNAWAILAMERPLVLFHAGIPFVLFEYFNALFAQPSVWPELDGLAEDGASAFVPPLGDVSNVVDGQWPISIPLRGEEIASIRAGGLSVNEKAQRYVSWSHYLRVKPRSELRRSMALDAYLTAVQFLFCHELGHIDRGHLEFRQRRNGSYSLSEFGASNGGSPVTAQQAMEFDADQYALRRALGPWLARGGSSNPSPRLGYVAAGTVDCYRGVLFAVGALFLLLEHQRKAPATGWWQAFVGWLRPRPDPTHPGSFTRIRGAFAIAEITAAKYDPSPDAIREACRICLKDLAHVASMLEIDSTTLGSGALTAEVLALVTELATLESEFAECRAAVKDRYFRDGRMMTAAQVRTTAKPVDPYGLRNQAVRIYLESEEVEIPFLHEDSPIEDFLANSSKWERVGRLDNAVVYAVLALRREASNTAVQHRVRTLGQTLGRHYSAIESLIAEHGPVANLAERLADSTDTTQLKTPPSALLEALEALVAMRPREAIYRFRLANEHYTRQEFGHALDGFVIAARGNLSDWRRVEALVNAGNCCAELGRTDEACTYFRRALDADPESEYAWTNLAICLVRAQRAAEAVLVLGDALKTDQENPEYWFLLAAANRVLGDAARVADCSARAVHLAPDDPKYLRAQGQLEFEAQRFREAIGFYSRALRSNPDDCDALDGRGRALAAIGELEAARADFKAVESLKKPLPTAATQALEEPRLTSTAE